MDYTHSLQIDNVLIEPGINKYEMEGFAGKKGVYTLNEMSLHKKQLNLLQNIPLPAPAFKVTTICRNREQVVTEFILR